MQDPVGLALLNWVLGYVSGASRYLPNFPADISNEQIVASIDAHCQEHPTDPVFRAAIALLGQR
jgi:hypothetical protein